MVVEGTVRVLRLNAAREAERETLDNIVVVVGVGVELGGGIS